MAAKLILNIAVSLDGYIADKAGGYAWITGHGDAGQNTKAQFSFDKFLAGGEMHGGVAMIDVNQFKSVNDSFGHLVGDEALQTVAAAMQSCLRQTDILIRYGGDEFLLLMPQNCPDGVESVIRRVQNAVQAARVPSHPELRLSVSIGGVCNVQPLTEAIRQADARMYCNKENGEPVL